MFEKFLIGVLLGEGGHPAEQGDLPPPRETAGESSLLVKETLSRPFHFLDF